MNADLLALLQACDHTGFAVWPFKLADGGNLRVCRRCGSTSLYGEDWNAPELWKGSPKDDSEPPPLRVEIDGGIDLGALGAGLMMAGFFQKLARMSDQCSEHDKPRSECGCKPPPAAHELGRRIGKKTRAK